MLFCYSGMRYNLRRHIYLNNYQIAYALLGSNNHNKKLTPNTPSAIDLKKYTAIKKMHNEHLERSRIGYNYLDKECISFDVINGLTKVRTRNDFCYGYNSTFGYLDTTGTASGLYSKQLISKAMNELIEKNEMLLLWYLKKGHQLVIDNDIKNLISRIGFYSNEVFVFLSDYISNVYTIAVVLFHKNQLMATGISLNEDENVGLINALMEAKLMESIFLEDSLNTYKDLFSKEDYEKIYEQIITFSAKFNKINYKQLSKKNIVLGNWVNNLEVAMLNIHPTEELATIRCCSTDLVNAIPLKEYLLESNKKILFKFGITNEYLLKCVNSIFI